MRFLSAGGAIGAASSRAIGDDPANGWLWQSGQSLFDVRPFGEMTIVQGAGWGGGSLIYANVHLRAPADIFQSGWPAGYGRAPRSILTTT